MTAALLAFLLAQPPAASPAAPAATRPDTGRRARPPRRLPVTPALAASAFADAGARALLERARAARLEQDSALAAYDARTYQRLSAGVGVRAFGRERLLMRAEGAARVQWSRRAGVTVETTGARAVFPAFVSADLDGEVNLDGATPIPYFPGRDALWLPFGAFGRVKAEVDERELVHPLAAGSEAYYRYASGGTAGIRLPNGRAITLRELRVTPRRPDFRLFVGSFWFDVATGQLVRAAYRMSEEIDVWRVAGEENKRDLAEALERARRDTSAAARAAVAAARREADDQPPAWVKGTFSPLSAGIGAVTVEYGLYGGRFWLPRRNVAEGNARAGLFRFPFSVEERYRYDRVDATTPNAGAGAASAGAAPAGQPAAPTLAAARTPVDSALALAAADSAGAGTSLNVTIGGDGRRRAQASPAERAQRADSALRALTRRALDERRRADSLRARGDTAGAAAAEREGRAARARAARLARREASCRAGAGSYDAGTGTRDDGALTVRVRRPCDPAALARSPDLPASPYEPGEALFGEADRDALLAALDFSLQPGWSPRPPDFRTGLAFLRFNRVEGASLGGEVTWALGRGYTAGASARLGTGDLVPNGELSLARGDGRRTARVAAYHRLAVSNDDWGNPLSFGASLASALYGRDEGFYHRAWGLELGGTRPAPAAAATAGWNPLRGATLGWRLFAEGQRGAAAELRRGLVGPGFVPNIAADRLVAVGAAGDLARTFGADPARTRLVARVRGEGAWARFDGPAANPFALDPERRAAPYARGLAEATLTQPLGRFALGLTGAAGAAAGDRVPVQRLFYVGGLQTVRGQFAQPVGAGAVGTAFWLARTELGVGLPAARPSVFYDAGWAGPRDRFATPGRPLSGAGVGVSFLDGLVRADVSRGITPRRGWRVDLSLDARF